MKKIFLTAVLFSLFAADAGARVNFLDHNYPGLDIAFTQSKLVNDASVVFAGGDDLDYWNISYGAFMRLNPYVEAGFNWGVKNLDPKIGSSHAGPGDVALGVKYNLFHTAEIGVKEPIYLLEGKLTLPTGDSTKWLGAGGYGLGLNFITGIYLDPFIINGDLGYTFYTRGNDRRQGMTVNYSANIDLPYTEELSLIGGLKGFYNDDDYIGSVKLNNSTSELYMAPGLVYKLGKDFNFNMNILLGMTDDSSDWAVYAGLEF